MQEDKKNVFEKAGLIQPGGDTEGPMDTSYTGSEDHLMDGEPVEAMSLLGSIAGVFVSPVRTFRSLTVKTHLLWPLIILGVVSAVSIFLSMDAMESFMRMTMEASLAKNPQAVPPEMIESQLQISMKAILITTPFIALLTPIVKGLVTQGMAKLFDGKGTMKATMSVIALSYMVIIAGSLIRLPLMMASETMITFSPALMLSPEQQGSAWAGFLMNFDLFTLWYLGVSAIGIREIHRISTGKAFVSVIIPFALVLLMSLSGVIMEKLI